MSRENGIREIKATRDRDGATLYHALIPPWANLSNSLHDDLWAMEEAWTLWMREDESDPWRRIAQHEAGRFLDADHLEGLA